MFSCDDHNDNLKIAYAPDCKSSTLSDPSITEWGRICGSSFKTRYRIRKPKNDKKLSICVVFAADHDHNRGRGFDIVFRRQPVQSEDEILEEQKMYSKMISKLTSYDIFADEKEETTARPLVSGGDNDDEEHSSADAKMNFLKW